MRIDIITIFPGIFNGPLDFSIIKRSMDKGIVEIHLHDLREFARNKYKSVDDYPFGGGAGMVMMIEPITECISWLKEQREYDEVIFLTPDGQLLNQNIANELSLKGNLILLCGHYKGIDERAREHIITRELSIGDYVLSGGELAAAILIDSLVRLIPGVLGDETSALSDSFQDGLLSPPVYTRPADFKGWKVPEILLSGHEAKIREWRLQQAIERTKKRRPELLDENE
jgi:tRNA (guanine37-N1)-methyltransferase